MTLPDVIDWLYKETVKPTLSPFYESQHIPLEDTAPCGKLRELLDVTYVVMIDNNGQPCCWACKSDGPVPISMDELPEQARKNTRWYTVEWFLYEEPRRIGNWYLSEGWGSREVSV